MPRPDTRDGLAAADRLPRRIRTLETEAVRLPVGTLGTDVLRRRAIWAELGSSSPVATSLVASTFSGEHVTLLHVALGAVVVTIAGEESAVREGAGLIGSLRDGDRITASDGARVMTASVPIDLWPPHLRREEVPPRPLLLPPSTGLQAFAAFVSAILRGGPARPALALAAADAILGMMVAMSADSARTAVDQLAGSPTGAVLRAYIDAHVEDGDLNADRVAAAFGLSRRTVYNLLGAEGITIMRYLQTQRLERVALSIRNDAPLSPAELVRRFGFSGREQLSRAFRARFGIPISEYRRQHGTRPPDSRRRAH